MNADEEKRRKLRMNKDGKEKEEKNEYMYKSE